jgi:hypothetical protein
MRSSLNLNKLDFTQFVENDLTILDTLKIDRKRKSMDAGKNRSANILLELCRGNNLFIVNGNFEIKHDIHFRLGQMHLGKGKKNLPVGYKLYQR